MIKIEYIVYITRNRKLRTFLSFKMVLLSGGRKAR